MPPAGHTSSGNLIASQSLKKNEAWWKGWKPLKMNLYPFFIKGNILVGDCNCGGDINKMSICVYLAGLEGNANLYTLYASDALTWPYLIFMSICEVSFTIPIFLIRKVKLRMTEQLTKVTWQVFSKPTSLPQRHNNSKYVCTWQRNVKKHEARTGRTERRSKHIHSYTGRLQHLPFSNW